METPLQQIQQIQERIQWCFENGNEELALQLEPTLMQLMSFAPSLNYSGIKCEQALAKIIGKNPLIQSVKNTVRKLVNLDDSVLIHGESGTGKELVAKALHGNRKGEFIDVNCAAISKDLFESELFGHGKGSFTGAYDDRVGKLQAAHGGTLFLDEIGEMPIGMQSKLLRALQEMQIVRVGSNKSIPISFRLVCATNRTLSKDIKNKKFRLDLYYRVSTFEIEVPALRDRRDDIPELVRVLSKGKMPEPFVAELENYFRNSEFDGNVRELQQKIRRWLVLNTL